MYWNVLKDWSLNVWSYHIVYNYMQLPKLIQVQNVSALTKETACCARKPHLVFLYLWSLNCCLAIYRIAAVDKIILAKTCENISLSFPFWMIQILIDLKSWRSIGPGDEVYQQLTWQNYQWYRSSVTYALNQLINQ